MFTATRHIIIGIIDFFHKPFARIIPVQPFRYLACGGSNTLLSIAFEYVAINFILHKSVTHIAGLNISPEVGAWIIANAITQPTGFILSRHIVYPESNLHSHIQLFRYLLTSVSFFVLSYLLVKFFAYFLPALNPTVAYAFICIIVSVLSYITQRVFTFKVTPEEVIAEEVVTE